MKHFLLSCFLLMLVLEPLSSQAQRRRGRSKPIAMGATFGIKGGAAFSNLSGTGTKAQTPLAGGGTTKTPNYAANIGLVGGALFNYRFMPDVSIQLEALYVGRGFERSLSTPVATGTRDEKQVIKLNYVDIPLLLKYNKQVFYLEGGLVASLLVGGSTTINDKKSGKPVTEMVNGYDVGGAVGLGIESPQGVLFGIRYVRGLVDIAKVGGKDPLYLKSTDGLNNSSFQLTAGFIFNHQAGRRRR